MTTTTKTQPTAISTVEVGETTHPRTVDATIAPGRRSTSWIQALKDRRRNRSDLARTIAAYPATRSAAAITLPTPQITAGQAPAIIPSVAHQQHALPAHLRGSRWSDAVG